MTAARVRTVRCPDLADDWHPLPVGMPLRLSIPAESGPKVLRLNGEYLLRANWPELVAANDSIEWFVEQPGDRDEFRTVLQVATVVSALIPGAQFLSPYLAAASVAYNLLVPPTVLNQVAPGTDVYSTSLSGNQAKLDQPVWRTCGIDRITPPFACQPYYEFDSNNDQYLYAVFALGYGPIDVLGEFIGKTPTLHFTDVLRHAYLAPGSQPTVALANVVTSQDVAGVELSPGRYAGGYVACQPGRTVKSIGYDVVAEQGLAAPVSEDDNPDGSVTVSWRIEYRAIDDGGGPIGNWQVLDSGTRTMVTNTPQRWSFKVDLPTPCRPEVRMGRTNLVNTDPNARDTITWAGMRAYLLDPAPLDPNVAHYEVVVRASQNLSSSSQGNFNMIVAGKCRTWSPDTGWNCETGDFTNYVATRNPAWWLADLWSNPIWGEGLPDERIDLQTLYDLAQTWDTRQDRFDYTFSTLTDAWTASQLIASAGRARVFRRYAVRTLARDELAEIGETAFTGRNTYGPMQINETTPRATDPDGIVVEYLSNLLWDTDTIECPCPGVSATDPTSPEYDPTLPMMSRPVYSTFDGIKGRTQAKREGLYHAADMALRTRTATCKTELQRIAVAVLTPVRFQPMIPGYGQTGDVAFWDAGSLEMSLTEKPDFGVGGDVYLTLRRDDGTLTTPVKVLPGSDVWSVRLPAAPDFDLVLDDGLRERPIFLLGLLDAGDEIVKVSAIEDGGTGPGGAQLYDLSFVVDDPRVHARDNPYLPGPGDIQDPVLVPTGDGESGGDALIQINLQRTNPDQSGLDVGLFASSSTESGIASMTFKPDGTSFRLSSDEAGGELNMATVWALFGAIDPSVGALYEIRFTYRPDVAPLGIYSEFFTWYGAPSVAPNMGDALNVWWPFTTARSVGLTTDQTIAPGSTAGYSAVQIDIRQIGATAVEGTGIVRLNTFTNGGFEI